MSCLVARDWPAAPLQGPRRAVAERLPNPPSAPCAADPEPRRARGSQMRVVSGKRVKALLATAQFGGASSVPLVSARGHAGGAIWIVVRTQRTWSEQPYTRAVQFVCPNARLVANRFCKRERTREREHRGQYYRREFHVFSFLVQNKIWSCRHRSSKIVLNLAAGLLRKQIPAGRYLSWVPRKALSNALIKLLNRRLTSTKLTDCLAFSFGPAHGLERRAPRSAP
jgi:hypothetical protein